MSEPHELSTATFGAGCFWGVEAHFRTLEGVIDAAAGYMGGTRDNPSYEEVCTGRTGHVEVVQLRYDPKTINYQRLLEAFWALHDPTQHNRQGADIGTQYRSVVFYHDAAQRDVAESMKQALNASGRYADPVVTAIEPATEFWRAEEYHQQYLAKQGGQCAITG